jgi:hypothetical protein
MPELELISIILPLDELSLIPLEILIEPPVLVLLLPPVKTILPPIPLAPDPTDSMIFPPAPDTDFPVSKTILPLELVADPVLKSKEPLDPVVPELELTKFNDPLDDDEL